MSNVRQFSGLYRLPFDSQNYPVFIVEGRNGPTKHRRFGELDDSTAVSFALPFNTPVLAARSGVVLNTVDSSDFYYDGEDPEIGIQRPGGETNYVAITHPDDTIAIYAHFGFAQVYVAPGEEITQGQKLGLTGPSGWVGSRPNLHFNVIRMYSRDLRSEGVPVTFRDYNGPLEHNELYPPHSGKESR